MLNIRNKILLFTTSIIAIYAIIGFIAIPKIAKSQIEQTLEKKLTENVSLNKIEFNPFLLKFTLYDFKIFNEKETTISMDKLYVDFAFLKSIEGGYLAFKDLQFKNPYFNIIEYSDGSINLAKLVKQDTSKATKEEKEEVEPKDSSSIKYLIHKTIIDNGKIKFTKQENDEKIYNLDIDKFNYTFYDIGTYNQITASHNLNVLINQNTKLEMEGGLKLEPFTIYGAAKLTNLKPSQFLDYRKDLVNFYIDDKTYANLNFGYVYKIGDKLSFSIDDAILNLNELDIRQNENSLISLKSLDIEGFNLSFPQREISIKNTVLDSLNSNIVKNKKNIINLANIIKDQREFTETKENIEEIVEETREVLIEENMISEKRPPVNFSMENISIKNSSLNYKDTPKSLQVKTKNIDINLKDISIFKDITIADINLSKPTISLKDKKNKIDIVNKELELSLKNFSLVNSVLNFEELKIKNKSLDFKDLKNKTQLFTKATKIELDKFNKQDNNITVSNVNLNNPSILFNDNKNRMKINTNSLNASLNNLDIKGNDLSVKNLRVKTPTVKINDYKDKKNITIKNVNLSALNTNYIKKNLKVSKVTLAKPTLYLYDRKTNKSVLAKRLNIKLHNITNTKKGLYVSKVNLYEPHLKITDEISKVSIDAKNLNLFINKISHKNNALKIVSSTINKPYLSFVLGKKPKEDKQEQKEKIVETKKETKKVKNKFAFDIGPVKIKNMKMRFEDKNLPIPFTTNITKMNGEFSRLNSNSSKPTKLNLEGTVDDYGYTKITGTVDINNIKLLTDTNLLFKNIEIKNLTQYLGKYLGRNVDSGKLDLDLKYNIKESDLNAENSIIINKIKLGEKSTDPDAMNLPIELAIALLEDTDGVIDLDLPVRGNVDEPQFSIGSIVLKVFTNLIVKAITSPFTLLASVFGIEEEDLKSLDFEFGDSIILPSEKESLDNIAKILSKKPKLAIRITPSYNSIRDRLAIQDKKFEKFLQSEMKEIPKGDKYKEVLEDLYEEQEDVKDLDEVEELFTKKDNNGKEFFENDEYVEYLRSYLASLQKIDKEELIELANLRVTSILNYLTKEKNVPKDALRVGTVYIQNAKDAKWSTFDLDIETR